jgi:drug/metabolite transporter (DMT)-like permease
MIAMQWRLAALTSVCITVGDVLNTAGMKREPEVEKLNLKALTAMLSRIARNPLVIGGVLSLTAGFFAMVSLLSIANVSFSVPATAISFVLETLLAKYILKEDVGFRRWVAASLVACGVVLLQW